MVSPFATNAGAQDDPTDLREGLVAAWNGSSWLTEQLGASTPLEGFGGPDWGVTLDAGTALAAVEAAFDTTNLALPDLWDALVADREAAVQVSGIDDPGRLAKAILLAVAIGEDPHSVGSDPGSDLVARLVALEQPAGDDAGLFGSASPTYDGAFRQGLALRALAAVGVTPTQASVDWLLNQQCDDGAWMSYRADLSTPCAFDGLAFIGPDSNSTASAVQALQTLEVPTSPLDWSDGEDWLLDNRNPDGGWGFFPGDPSDPNSTASALQALVTATDRSIYPSAAEALIGFQIACSAGTDPGAFEVGFAPGFGDLMATTQVVAVLALDGNLANGETPAADAGLRLPTAPCVAVADLVEQNPETSTTTTTAPEATSDPGPDPTTPVTSPTGASTTDTTPPAGTGSPSTTPTGLSVAG